jgi:Zn-dependent peptidase ImmA (M78 family)/transcriptional regulator with XRE-family HTH domain
MNNVLSFKPSLIIPERLREAREAMELSMTDLAEKIGVSRQAVSLYEDGQRAPEPEILMRIVQVLQQPIAYFTTSRPPTFGHRGTRFFRAFKSKTKRQNTRCEILSDWFAQAASYFSDSINLPPVLVPEIPPPQDRVAYSDEEIEDAATFCRRHWDLGDGPIANIVALLESKGIIIARAEFGNEDVSAFSFWEGPRPFIFLGADRESACRSRYDACHELAHLLLHRGIDTSDLEHDLDRIEREADRFSAAFLLPEKTYSMEVFSSRLATFIHLKNRWKVSAAAQIYRCSELGILDEHQILNLRKQLSANRWRKREPLDDKIAPELPAVMEKCLRLLLDSGRKTVGDILAGIRLAQNTLEALMGVRLPVSDDVQGPKVSLRGEGC